MKNLILLLAFLLLVSAGTCRAGSVVVGYAPVSYPPYSGYAPAPYYAPPPYYYYPPPYAYYGPGPYYYGPRFYGPPVFVGFHIR